ncbi:TPA: DM13 domain-containing protein [Burkholderia aenigmatica]|uniref:DM13 domain-containing protein n=1 Tax=Burkholderia sp. AU45251 TaxID=3059204 RepID=UPI00264E8D84|nr:DM13 domain-containing protein [Burkholderia sp. AU45251]HDR9486728.1 DM13 domain-containing protein [Burkholderia aenigmatica]MDN7519579.1 DM13 domain-containing protein [Burkholderia sp. AU45251]HDR9488625.1 DM13 domain-containing protein [Burkholderia aenigmatica]HDR9518518.1 DM13 domain-containing protein [Burkholderia aenigmatica]HDR9520759.1 DM13 domain-containing protein [Burkholderia aenigmatica]
MKNRIWIPIASHLATALVAFTVGIYVLPVLTASEGATAVELQVAAENARHTGCLERDLRAFGNFVVPLPADVNPAQYTSVVIWCARFSTFIRVARYRNATTSCRVPMQRAPTAAAR